MMPHAGAPASGPPAKRARLSEQRAAPMPSGANLIEVDGKTCTHEVAWPPGQEGGCQLPPPARPGPSAREYPFKIDPFQQTAINSLEAGHSVLVAAHTSAGKTVVAEYAFAMALRDGQRVIYTSPLKALSNQKYRELHETFGDVGLMTGDVTINPTASCLVMTTEILRSMLYRGSEVVREVQLIVYDEIHYLRDKERGVVWEESIVMAPSTARFAFLSATIPNAREFAEWVATTHGSPCHVVYTDYRPTPLEHFVFPAGADGLFLVVDERGSFREENFQKAIAVVNDATADGGNGKGGGKGGKKGGGGGGKQQAAEDSDIYKLVRMILARNFDPAIVFSFSKKECEALGAQMVSLELNDEPSRKMVDAIFHSAVDCLSEEDRRLPQIQNALPQLRRGIAVHHSGLLPILKELVEILFQEGLIKILFATETFSTGLNMPAKTVVFTNARKYDGGGFRWLRSGEYIQMSGRAGRRGLDEKGVAILMLDHRMEPAVAKDMVKGAADPLYSEFHLQYSMLLNLLRVEDAEPEALMRRSYRQFQAERALPSLEARTAKLEAERDAIQIEGEKEVRDYQALEQQLAKLRRERQGVVTAPNHALPFLQPGRLVRVLPPAEVTEGGGGSSSADAAGANGSGGSANGGSGSGGGAPHAGREAPPGVWGAVVNFEKVGKAGEEESGGGGRQEEEGGGGRVGKRRSSYLLDVLLNCTADSAQHSGRRRAVPVPASQPGLPLVVPVTLAEVADISSVRVYIPQDLRTPEARTLGLKALGEVARRFGEGGMPLLDPEEDMRIESDSFRKLQRKIESIESLMAKHALAKSGTLASRLEALAQKQYLGEAARLARKEVKTARGLILQEELKGRRKVLKRLGYVDKEGIVTLKGRVASGISTGDELVLTEMIFGGAFKDLSPQQICAVVSCFVWREKSESGNKVREDLEGAYAALREAARRVGKQEEECKLAVEVEEYVDSFRPDLMDIVARWCQGAKFADIMKLTNMFEGSLVRAVRRLEELLRQLAAALRAVGDLTLAERFEAGIEQIKRDIIFAASLYL